MSEHNGWDAGSAARSRTRNSRAERGVAQLSLTETLKFNQPRSFDPYDTSGGFDRKRNWERVGKR